MSELAPVPVPPAAPATPYPSGSAGRDRWVLARRGPRPVHDPTRPHAVFVERERTETGTVADVLTVLLVSRECPWRCVMCDLWKYTVPGPIAPGLIPRQLAAALATVSPTPRPTRLKLYNGGSFFDPRAVPPTDLPAVAGLTAGFDRLIVECHPRLVDPRVLRFRDQLQAAATDSPPPVLEVALGLETAHPGVLPRLNKRFTLEGFRRAADFLLQHGLALRVFVLVQPPFLPQNAAVEWAGRSLEFAFDCGATAAVLIPTRLGNGALEALGQEGHFAPPRLETFEHALDLGLRLGRGRVFADLWNLAEFSRCPACLPARRARLECLNLTQSPAPPVTCLRCGSRVEPPAGEAAGTTVRGPTSRSVRGRRPRSRS